MKESLLSQVWELVNQFAIYGELEHVTPYGPGHINDTFVSQWNQAGTQVRYLHQRINERIFHRPDQVIENIHRVTTHLVSKLPPVNRSRRTLTLVPAKDGTLWVRDEHKAWWRTYLFIEGTHTLETSTNPEAARFLGKSIGWFQKQLADLANPKLHETIPNFHNMETRYTRFYEALSKDAYKRAQYVSQEIAFMRENEARGSVLIQALKTGHIPERICHNDTKINNILIDNATGEALCVVDLDTVMPGTSLFDLGDLIRTVTTTAAEDEQDITKVTFDPIFFEALVQGYLSEALEFLSVEEKSFLVESGRNITHIMALRFLTDYLEGDQYYHISRPEHNVDRCRNQIALIRSLDAQWDMAEQIVNDALIIRKPAS